MAKKNYSVTLESETVDAAKQKLKTGQKLSPVIDFLLKRWVNEDGK